MTTWQLVHIGPENDDFAIAGVNVWRWPWRQNARGRVELPLPHDASRRRYFNVYDVGGDLHPVTFAAGELSNGIFAFYREVAL